MKIAFLNTWRGGAVYNVTFPLKAALEKLGHEVDYLTLDSLSLGDFDDTWSDYDILHVCYFVNLEKINTDAIEIPYTCGVHHLPCIHLPKYATFLRTKAPWHIVIPEPYPQRQLGELGICNTTIIPYAFDNSPYHLLPYPDNFTIGYVGCNYETKRFQIIDRAAQELGIPLSTIKRETNDERQDFLPHEDILSAYKDMSCYVVASYIDGGPLPPQEALLCGRPVITTRVGMMPQIIEDGINGLFFDGTPSDLKRKIQLLRENYKWYALHARNTLLPDVDVVALEWEKMFEKVIG